MSKSKKILLVDDEDDIVFILKTILARRGYVVREAYSGEECFEILKKEKPDLIFLDIMMPGIDGWEVARRIKTDPQTRDIPVSMLSIKSGKMNMRRSREYSFADEHIKKPIDFDVVLNTAERLTTNTTSK